MNMLYINNHILERLSKLEQKQKEIDNKLKFINHLLGIANNNLKTNKNE